MIRSKTGFAKKIFLQLNMCCLHSVRNLRNFPLSFSREQPPRGGGRFSIALAVCMLMKDGDSIAISFQNQLQRHLTELKYCNTPLNKEQRITGATFRIKKSGYENKKKVSTIFVAMSEVLPTCRHFHTTTPFPECRSNAL